MRTLPYVLLCLGLFPLAGCQTPPAAVLPPHEHKAPHHGALVELGEEFSHVEIVEDPATGRVTAYVLDGEAENPVRIVQPTLRIHLLSARLPDMVLKAVPNPLTGETVGDTSQFEDREARLKGVQSFQAEIDEITVRGEQFRHMEFHYP